MTPARKVIFLLNDIICMTFALMAAVWLRFELLEPRHIQHLFVMVPFLIPTSIVVFWVMGLYNRTLRFTSISDMMAVFNAVTISSMMKMTFAFFYNEFHYSRSVLILDWMLTLLLIGSSRIMPRILLNVVELEPLRSLLFGKISSRGKRVIIIGAGQAGESIIREIRRNRNLPMDVVGFIDDDPKKLYQIIHGVKVLGDRHCLTRVLASERIDEIIIAIPSASGEVLREIVKQCRDSNVRFKTLPGLQDLLDGKLVSLQLRDIAIEDLLRRAPAETNLAEIAAYMTGKAILITGAGGSIGSEICRQILPFKPAKLLLLGHGENSIFNCHNELYKNPEAENVLLVPIIADIQDLAKIKQVFRFHRPEIVFHAAAHKHVPMMEANPEEAVKNNVLGTLNLIEAAHEFEIERFVMISTDKAVNPTSVMGATKRVAEMLLKCYAKRSATRFVAVRFGNVLGSRGSVIPLFKEQIENGGPITITHPNMIRYFMTIPEASKLVVQAGAYGKGGEVFVLDMGDPVKIVDLAMDLIRLSGLETGKDIEIKYSGIRPGEKLYEELLTADEGITATRNKKIFIAKPEEVEESKLMPKVQTMLRVADNCSQKQIIECLKSIIPSFAPNRDQVFNQNKTKPFPMQSDEKPQKQKFMVV